MTDSSHAHLGLRLPDTGGSSRSGPAPPTRHPTIGNHRLSMPPSTIIPAQRPPLPPMTPALPTRGDFPGPRPHKGHVTHKINQACTVPQARQENTVYPRADAEIPRAVQNADIPAELQRGCPGRCCHSQSSPCPSPHPQTSSKPAVR
jgi:hypothetical protein